MTKKAADRSTAEQQAGMEALAALSDERIDTSDAPEILDWPDACRGRFHKPIRRQQRS